MAKSEFIHGLRIKQRTLDLLQKARMKFTFKHDGKRATDDNVLFDALGVYINGSESGAGTGQTTGQQQQS